MYFNPPGILFLSFVALFPLAPQAELTVIQKNDLRPAKVHSARIFYNGNVNTAKALELTGALEKLNHNYPALEHITLYINSYGGDMDAGYIASSAVSSSAIPITTVNLSMVASSATLFYCAAKERLAMPSSHFLLHSASVQNRNQDYLKSEDLDLLRQGTDAGNTLFMTTYKSCSNLEDKELKTILYSEASRAMWTAKEAVSREMATGLAEKLRDSDISLYITDKD